MTDRPRIVLDCDPGCDDAIAIATAIRYTELVAITSVAGNVGLDYTTHNALAITELMGAEVPVHRGAAGPLDGQQVLASEVHGATGIGGATLPEPTRSVASDDAVGALVEMTRAEEGLHLVPVGPLTNIALALQADPAMAGRVASITIMGGSAGAGNITPTAEFNIYADPQAAREVFRAGAPMAMAGLNLTHQVRMGAPHANELREVGTTSAVFVADLLDFYSNVHLEASGNPLCPIHDPCAVLYVAFPELFHTRPRHVDVEVGGDLTHGMTVVDERVRVEPQPATVDVMYGCEADRCVELIMAAAAEPLG